MNCCEPWDCLPDWKGPICKIKQHSGCSMYQIEICNHCLKIQWAGKTDSLFYFILGNVWLFLWMNWLLQRNFRPPIIQPVNLSGDVELHPRANRPLHCKFCFNSPRDTTDRLSRNYFKNITEVKVMYTTESSNLFFPSGQIRLPQLSSPRFSCKPSKERAQMTFPRAMTSFECGSSVCKIRAAKLVR